MSSPPPFVGDHYQVLGVEKKASTEDIKKAFRKLARECHPDVAGDDPDAARRFNQVRQSYEVLVDPTRRAAYDRSMERKPYVRSGSWRMPGGFKPGTTHSSRGGPRRKARREDPANKLNLDDIFGDQGGGAADFGFGRDSRAGGSGPGRPRAGQKTSTAPQPGRDVTLQVDVATDIARSGGTVTLRYPRLRRGDDGRTLFRYDELYDLRVPPGTAHGETLRVSRMGDAGPGGGPWGDLLCDVRVVPGEGRSRRPERDDALPKSGRRRPDTPPMGSEPKTPTGTEAKVVPISVSEALLGGRVTVQTAHGPVRLSVPPGSSGGTRLRLRGKGVGGRDLYVQLRIMVPRSLDDESRELIERFAALNPEDPRD